MKSVDFAIDESMLINTTNPKKTVVLSKDVKAYLEELRYNDQKTIQELAKEVKRLTKLVPRAAIEKDEESEDSNMKSEESMGDNNHEEDLYVAIPAPENKKTTTDQFFPSRSKYDSFDETELQRRNNNYTFFQLIFSFVAGCVLMLIWLWKYLPS
jgi:isochorismate hydrolase